MWGLGLLPQQVFSEMAGHFHCLRPCSDAGELASSYSLGVFTSAGSVSDYAETAMAWVVERSIITGMTDTTIVPRDTAARAQCAAMLMRFVEL